MIRATASSTTRCTSGLFMPPGRPMLCDRSPGATKKQSILSTVRISIQVPDGHDSLYEVHQEHLDHVALVSWSSTPELRRPA